MSELVISAILFHETQHLLSIGINKVPVLVQDSIDYWWHRRCKCPYLFVHHHCDGLTKVALHHSGRTRLGLALAKMA